MVQELLDKIHSTAYWRVLIRPAEFRANRIPSLGRCGEIVRSSQVVLRGWNYPHIDDMEVGQDWIESGYGRDIVPHREYWRFYQSGQFVHHFSCWEDLERLPRTPAPSRYLDVLDTLYTATEILEFAARVAHHAKLSGAVEFTIQLHDMFERQLTFWEGFPRTMLLGRRVAQIDPIEYNRTIPVTTLLGSASEAALDAAIAIFERFGWLNPSRSMLEKDQQKFLKRELGA